MSPIIILLAVTICRGGGQDLELPTRKLWPEAQLFVGVNQRTRVFLIAAYAKGKESDERSHDAAA